MNESPLMIPATFEIGLDSLVDYRRAEVVVEKWGLARPDDVQIVEVDVWGGGLVAAAATATTSIQMEDLVLKLHGRVGADGAPLVMF